MGLPLVEKFDIKDIPVRASLAATAKYTEDLLKKSLSEKMSDGRFFFTESVVKAYLVRLYFWIEDWDNVISLCSDMIANSGLALTPPEEYATMIQADKAALGEVITRSHINDASELDWYFASVKGFVASRPASASLRSLFDKENDVRYAASFNDKLCNAKAPECRIRLSEIVLMLSEAYCHINDSDNALKWLNELRRHRIRGVADLTEDTLPELRTGNRIVEDAEGDGLTPLMQAILDERRRELCLEGDRWFELKRNGSPEWWVISNGLKYTTKKYMYTAPIYKGDVDLNPDLKQNPGYE